jgi:hypothetical protein
MAADPRDRPTAKQIVATLERAGAGGGKARRAVRWRGGTASPRGRAPEQQAQAQAPPPPTTATELDGSEEPSEPRTCLALWG